MLAGWIWLVGLILDGSGCLGWFWLIGGFLIVSGWLGPYVRIDFGWVVSSCIWLVGLILVVLFILVGSGWFSWYWLNWLLLDMIGLAHIGWTDRFLVGLMLAWLNLGGCGDIVWIHFWLNLFCWVDSGWIWLGRCWLDRVCLDLVGWSDVICTGWIWLGELMLTGLIQVGWADNIWIFELFLVGCRWLSCSFLFVGKRGWDEGKGRGD